MAKIIAVYSVKGGVGKTSLAVNLAGISALKSGHKTLLWDLDAQGAASFLCADAEATSSAKAIFARDVSPTKSIMPTRWPQLDLLMADASLRAVEPFLHDLGKPKRLRKILDKVAPHYEYIILDCPPGLSDLTDQIFHAADIVLFPIVPTALGARALDQVTAHLADWGAKAPTLLPMISMADRRKALHRAFESRHPDWLVVPQASVIEQMGEKRAPIEAFARATKPAQALRAIWEALEQRLPISKMSRVKASTRGRPRIPKAKPR